MGHILRTHTHTHTHSAKLVVRIYIFLLTQDGNQFVCERLIVNISLKPDAKDPLNLVSDGTVTDEGSNCKIIMKQSTYRP